LAVDPAPMAQSWLAKRTKTLETSLIEQIFNLAATLKDKIDLSIGQPHFDVPQPIKEAACQAIAAGRNRYSQSEGIDELRCRLREKIRQEYLGDDREVMITCGSNGALTLSMLALIDPGDQVILFDPWFVVYDPLVRMVGGEPVYVDTYPSFRIDPDRVARAITPRTKMIIVNSPNNPTGVVATEEEVRALAELAFQRGVLILSDEIYRDFCFGVPFSSPGQFNPYTLVVGGFSKTYGMPGWRLGYAHGPRSIIEQMIKVQQYTFVCPPHPLQWAALTALDTDVSQRIVETHRKCDAVVEGLAGYYEFVRPTGAFYAFLRVPWGTGSEFARYALQRYKLLVIPGRVFSTRDTHFRIAFTVDDRTLEEGIRVLRELAISPPST